MTIGEAQNASGRFDRRPIERLAAESPTVEWYDVAVAAYAEQFALSGPRHPARRALDRLARLYIRHFRRELVRQHRFHQGGGQTRADRRCWIDGGAAQWKAARRALREAAAEACRT
jgi:hypothetical protein